MWIELVVGDVFCQTDWLVLRKAANALSSIKYKRQKNTWRFYSSAAFTLLIESHIQEEGEFLVGKAKTRARGGCFVQNTVFQISNGPTSHLNLSLLTFVCFFSFLQSCFNWKNVQGNWLMMLYGHLANQFYKFHIPMSIYQDREKKT